MVNKIGRRSFIKKTGVIGSVISFSSSSLFSSSSDEKRIIIVGAGLAGLSCAYELDQAGYNVILIEAKSLPGGRVSTYRDQFSDNLYSEMGAEYVDSSDLFVHDYCRRFNLKILPARQYDGVYVRGNELSMERIRSGENSLPYNGTEDGMLFGQEVQYIQKWIDLVKDKGINSTEVQALDNVSVESILKKGGAPKDIIELYTYANATESTTTPSKISALAVILSNIKTSGFSENTVEGRIFGGNDQLPKILSKKIENRIKYNSPLLRLDHNSDGVIATISENGKPIKIKAAKCVLAIPTTILKNIEIYPKLSNDKIKCINEQAYGNAMKIAIQFKKRFWDNGDSIGQRVFTDTVLRRIYHFSVDQPGPRGILLSFTSGKDAMKLGKLGDEERDKIVKNTCLKIWKDSSKYWERSVSKYWNDDKWIKASYTFSAVGQKNFREILSRNEDPLYFAGEHTAFQRASMNGAIESGLRTTKEIVKAMSFI